MSDEFFTYVITPNVKTYKLRSSAWTVRFGTARQIRAEDKQAAAAFNRTCRRLKRRRQKYWEHVIAKQAAIIGAERAKHDFIIHDFNEVADKKSMGPSPDPQVGVDPP